MDLDSDLDHWFGFVKDSATAVPQEIHCSDVIFTHAFHPCESYLVCGLVSGMLELHKLELDQSYRCSSYKLHKGGISALEFSESGSHLVTVGSDCCLNILDTVTEKVVRHMPKDKKNFHKFPISAVNFCNETVLSTGDDDGRIVLWDTRKKNPIGQYHEHADYISQILFFCDPQQIITTSGDTCLGVFDFRKLRLINISDKRKDELSSMAYIPPLNSILCGTPSGALPIWKYGSWVRPYNQIESHPREVDTILTYNDNIILTGACDGVVRVLQMFPIQRDLCHLGGGTSKEGIHRMSIDHERRLLSTTGCDEFVRFVNIEFLGDDKNLDAMRTYMERQNLSILRDWTAECEQSESDSENVRSSHKKKTPPIQENTSMISFTDNSSVVKDSEKKKKPKVKKSSKKILDNLPEEESVEAIDSIEQAIKDKKEEMQSILNPYDDTDSSLEDSEMPLGKRQKQRARLKAVKWIKEAKKKKIIFPIEKSKKRTKGFWENLV